MVPRMVALGLVLALVACGREASDARELRHYVARMRQAEVLSHAISTFARRLDQPDVQISAADLVEARALIDRYIAAMEQIPSAAIRYPELRILHDLFRRRLSEARSLAAGTGRDPGSERGEVAITMRYIGKQAQQHYAALEVLWLRTDQDMALALQWPE